jgi:hypothetical protein
MQINNDMISIGSDTLVSLNGLIDNLSNTYQNAATANAVLMDTGQTTTLYSFTLAYVPLSNGNYQGTIPVAQTALLYNNGQYLIIITVLSSGATRVFYYDDMAQMED